MCLFREPDAGNLPVRFDERDQETELCQAGLRRVVRKHPNSHREAKATAPVLDSTLFSTDSTWRIIRPNESKEIGFDATAPSTITHYPRENRIGIGFDCARFRANSSRAGSGSHRIWVVSRFSSVPRLAADRCEHFHLRLHLLARILGEFA